MESTPALAMPVPELVLRTGRQRGARRPLKAPITFIGSAAGCDIRLGVESVKPIHCVVAMGADGPILRASAGADVRVNGAETAMRLLQDGDVIQVGPFAFEIDCAAPLALPADEPPAPDSSADEKLETVRLLQKQLNDARAEFRRERTEQEREIARQLLKLGDVRAGIQRSEKAVARERSRLLQLRKRFVRRWKTHWSSERQRIQKEDQRLTRAAQALAAREEAWKTERDQAHAHFEVEQRRIDAAWEQLRDAQTGWNEQREAQNAELEARRRQVAEDERRLQSERAALQRDVLFAQNHVGQLRIEASGLECRIVHLREVLTRMQAEHRATPSTEAPSSNEGPPKPVDERLIDLDRLIADVSDQRRVLLEQTDRLAEARDAWRDEEIRLVHEMEQLGKRLRGWEDRLVNRELNALREDEAIERERSSLQQLSDRLESWQARLNARDMQQREEWARIEADWHLKSRQVERRELALTDQTRRWSERRRQEVQQLRTEHRRWTKIRMEYERQRAAMDERQRTLLQRQRDLAVQALAIEQGRQKLLAAAADPRLAAKKLERLQWHIERANRKRDELLEQRWQKLHHEQKELLQLFRQTGRRIEECAALERGAADRIIEAERRECRLTDRETSLSENETLWSAHKQSYEREINELRDEIDRLSGLLIEAGPAESIPLARAA